MEGNYGVNRKIIAYNFFVIVGPTDDPAEIAGLNVTSALNHIYAYGHNQNSSIWISRDDRSGTNTKEMVLWTQTGFDYDEIREEPWFVSSGTGMGSTIQIASELGLYVLSDIGTYFKYSSENLTALQQHVSSDSTLINVYSAIAVNSSHVEGVKFDLAMELMNWLVSSDAQELIESYGRVDYGQSLFIPAVSIIQTQEPLDVFSWIQTSAFFDINGTLYECPPQWRSSVSYSLVSVFVLKISQKVREDGE
jgi:tungstate transport system substrate-binding protein